MKHPVYTLRGNVAGFNVVATHEGERLSLRIGDQAEQSIATAPMLETVVAEELGELRQAATAFLRQWGGHSGSCCTFDNNGVPSLDGNYQVIVTRESCKCPPINKALRDALGEWEPREWERQP